MMCKRIPNTLAVALWLGCEAWNLTREAIVPAACIGQTWIPCIPETPCSIPSSTISFSSSKPLLSGLEEEEDRTAQALLPLLQELGSCIQSAKVASILASEQRREALSMAAFFHLLPCPTTLLKAKAGVRSTDMEQPCT